MNYRNILKDVIPPVFLRMSNRANNKSSGDLIWAGRFNSWQDAKDHGKGYNSGIILEKVKLATLKVKNGEAVYERDSVLFDEVQYAWPLLAALLKIASERNGKLNVLDFGGSLGSSYFQNRDFLNLGANLKWNIIEQEHFVDCGKAGFEDDSLKFYYDIESCLEQNNPDVLLLSGVLQYLDDPFQWISKFTSHSINYIIVDRTAFVEGDTFITVQKGSEHVDYPAWFFNKPEFIKKWIGYEKIAEFPDHTTAPVYIDLQRCYWAGFFLAKKKSLSIN